MQRLGKVNAQAFHHHPLFLNSFSVKGLSWFLAAFFWVKSSSPLLKNPLSRASFIDSKGKFWAHFTWSLSSRSPTKVKVSRESFAVKAPKKRSEVALTFLSVLQLLGLNQDSLVILSFGTRVPETKSLGTGSPAPCPSLALTLYFRPCQIWNTFAFFFLEQRLPLTFFSEASQSFAHPNVW